MSDRDDDTGADRGLAAAYALLGIGGSVAMLGWLLGFTALVTPAFITTPLDLAQAYLDLGAATGQPLRGLVVAVGLVACYVILTAFPTVIGAAAGVWELIDHEVDA